ncbi:hypothetical protein P872_08325 [Rhodonellum psychrophilum GCM71 = DSM 17998]|uniref:Methyltransferase type 11 n=2 Tax=Rhodonellum TaxID=336827 RepID=U5BZQ9_9BACT|nr:MULTISPECIES: class I SAM-dependent methyltransferase [Rhodonellum]ERM82166.1 hypothetical protein P872_08325 [Rhodonellum psychrophilum GCM71 = DSM 17998]SDY63090.1 Methyltransferase domain-containing protein [Rhodonellum ikkaensis]
MNEAKIDKSNTCVACGNSQDNRIFQSTERMFGLGGSFDFLECSSCQSVQLIAVPKKMDAYYPNNYYAFGNLVKSDRLKNLIKKIRWSLASANLLASGNPAYLTWLKTLRAKTNEHIADIGCGNGQLVYEMKSSGFKNLWGFDPYLSQETKTNGFQLLRKSIDEVSGKFDVVMMHHSFEHMEFPRKVFEKLSQIVKKGGRLLIRVPVTDGEVWKQEGIYWFQLDSPRHFYIPSVKAMKMISSDFGFSMKPVVFDSGANQFWGPILYKKGMKFAGTDLSLEFTAEELLDYENKAIALNQENKGDQACFYFEKI